MLNGIGAVIVLLANFFLLTSGLTFAVVVVVLDDENSDGGLAADDDSDGTVHSFPRDDLLISRIRSYPAAAANENSSESG
jgi:hypothetical protein